MRAIGETLERYASLHALGEDDEVLAKFVQSGIADRFPRCSEAEACPPMFKGRNWDVPVGHVRMLVVASGEEVLVPTPYVHLGYVAPNNDVLATYPISTGTAYAPSRHRALWRGLCEVAERDAIMLFWLTRRSFRRILIDPGTGPSELSTRTLRIRDVELEYCLLDITTDFRVPTVIAILNGHDYPYMTVGASCQADPIRACCKALDEAVSVRYSLRHDRWRHEPIPSYEDFVWVRRLEHHMCLYGSWAAAPPLSFVHDSPSVTLQDFAADFDGWEPRDELELRRFAATLAAELGLTVLAADLPCSDTEPFGYVTKVVVPEMMPLSQDHNARWLETERLKVRLEDREINSYPHPFA